VLSPKLTEYRIKEAVVQLLGHADVEKMSHLTQRQRSNVATWMRLQDTLNRGSFDAEMDAFFHPEFTYGNPTRPDLGSYLSWKTSPMELFRRFPPSHYRTIDAVAKGDQEIWVHCHHTGKHTGGNYMGKAPSGNEFAIEWFSIVSFRDGKIIRIFSIADVLTMLIKLGVLDKSSLPVDPYK
jgi:ketosteroid isomerase-like protein